MNENYDLLDCTLYKSERVRRKRLVTVKESVPNREIVTRTLA